jgi:hypothetical protein
MRLAPERLEGTGTLRSASGPHIPVKYSFVIEPKTPPGAAGAPPSPARVAAHGKVTALTGEALQKGVYTLVLGDGSRERVEHLPPEWFILAPLT